MNEQQEQAQTQEQTCYLHIVSIMHEGQISTCGSTATVYCGLSVMVYRTREFADRAQSVSGGLVIKTVASELRPRDPDPVNGDDIMLCHNGGAGDRLEPKDPNEFIFVGLALEDLPHTVIPGEVQHTEVGDYAPESIQFPPEINAWIIAFEKASGLIATL